jgi:hypothetical protein
MEQVGFAPHLPLSYSAPIHPINVTNLITLKPPVRGGLGQFSRLSWVRFGRHERTVTVLVLYLTLSLTTGVVSLGTIEILRRNRIAMSIHVWISIKYASHREEQVNTWESEKRGVFKHERREKGRCGSSQAS